MGCVVLRNIVVDCIVGILPSERITPQRVEIDVDLHLSLTEAGDTGNLNCSVDYAAVAEQVRWIAQVGRFRLVESLGLVLVRSLLVKPNPFEMRAKPNRVEIEVRKPTILGGQPIVGIRIAREGPFCPQLDNLDGAPAFRLIAVPEVEFWRVFQQEAPSAEGLQTSPGSWLVARHGLGSP